MWRRCRSAASSRGTTSCTPSCGKPARPRKNGRHSHQSLKTFRRMTTERLRVKRDSVRVGVATESDFIQHENFAHTYLTRSRRAKATLIVPQSWLPLHLSSDLLIWVKSR